MSPEHEERVTVALELLGASMSRLYDVMQARLNHDYPPAKEPRDATITHLQTSEERLRASQGQSEEPIEEWIGLREERFVRDEVASKESGEPEE